MIRIEITYQQVYVDSTKETRIKVKEFDDDFAAQKWLVEDSYFAESYVKSVLWERV